MKLICVVKVVNLALQFFGIFCSLLIAAMVASPTLIVIKLLRMIDKANRQDASFPSMLTKALQLVSGGSCEYNAIPQPANSE